LGTIAGIVADHARFWRGFPRWFDLMFIIRYAALSVGSFEIKTLSRIRCRLDVRARSCPQTTDTHDKIR
jgi:hypothetical protein